MRNIKCQFVKVIYLFLAKVRSTSTGKLLEILPRNDAVVKLGSGEFILAFFRATQARHRTKQGNIWLPFLIFMKGNESNK
jgi:hypothetical protein